MTEYDVKSTPFSSGGGWEYHNHLFSLRKLLFVHHYRGRFYWFPAIEIVPMLHLICYNLVLHMVAMFLAIFLQVLLMPLFRYNMGHHSFSMILVFRM